MVANFAYVWITSAVLQVLLSPAINIIMSHYRINAIIQKRAGLITAPTGYRATLGHAAGQVRAIVDTLALLIMCIAFWADGASSVVDPLALQLVGLVFHRSQAPT